MNEGNPIDSKALVDVTKTAKEVLPQTVIETDSAISTLVGWFNNVVLYPVKKANMTYRYKLECFEEDLRKKVDLIPDDKICSPNLMIAGPTLESLKYTYDEQELREMYVNLLAASMNTDKIAQVHPSYVDIIKQMTPDEAKLLKKISTQPVFPVIHVKQYMEDEKSYNDIVINYCNLGRVCCDFPEKIYSYINNLDRLGLLNISYSSYCMHDGAYDELESQFDDLRVEGEKLGCKIKISRGLMELSALGHDFAEICIQG